MIIRVHRASAAPGVHRAIVARTGRMGECVVATHVIPPRMTVKRRRPCARCYGPFRPETGSRTGARARRSARPCAAVSGA
jgi:hypothetical protein